MSTVITASAGDDWRSGQINRVTLHFDELSATTRAKVVKLKNLDATLARKKQSQLTVAADLFAFQCHANKMPAFAREVSFAQELKRKWRFDFAWDIQRTLAMPRPIRLAVEIEGIAMRCVRIDGKLEWIMGGRHASIAGFKEDCVKYAAAALLGWTVLRFEQSQVSKGIAVNMTMRVLYRMGWRAVGEPT